MAAQVRQRAAAEIPVLIPPRLAVDVAGVKGPLRRRPEPQVPMQGRRHGHDLCRAAAVAPGARDPDVDVAHRANGPGLDELHHAPVIVAGVNLGAHLRGDAGLGGGLGEQAGFPDAMGQRLLAIHVLAELEGRQDRKRVRVLRAWPRPPRQCPCSRRRACGSPRISGPRDTWRRRIEVFLVHVAQRDDVLAGHLGGVRRAASAGADDRDVELLVGGNTARLWPGDGVAVNAVAPAARAE